MENMQYAEELLREFLVFRGFTATLQVFERELATDIGKSFQVDKIVDLIFTVYVPEFQASKLVSLLNFFKQCISSEEVLIATLSKLEASVLRYYVVHAIQSGRREKVIEFFETIGNDLLQIRDDWMQWFAIPYVKSPHISPQFRVYFSKEWYDALLLSFRNFLSEIFNGTRIPALLKISTEKNTVKHLKNDIKQLNLKLSELQALLEIKEAEIHQLRRKETASRQNSLSTKNPLVEATHVKTGTGLPSGCISQSKSSQLTSTEKSISQSEDEVVSIFETSSTHSAFKKLESLPARDDGTTEPPATIEGHGGEIMEEEFPEVKVEFQESFLGHTSPISRCRFSASGTNIASASTDGTVRIWTYDSSTPSSKNATIYCGAEIMSLDWECRYDRLLFIGTADGGIKAWNVDAKRVVCDLNTSSEYPSVLDLKCSPVEPIFVSAAASKRSGSGYIEKMGFASLTVWNMKTWKATTVLPLGKDPPAITSVCFNHNGKILAASAADGMIHMFDMSAGLQITGWPAHDSAVNSVLFGPDETSIFSLGTDGKIFEWSLHNQGQVLWSRESNIFCHPDSLKAHRHEIALDSNGRMLLLTSNSVRSPIYQVQGHRTGMRTLPHSAAITSVDWHPTLPIYITGSADHSVRVTSIL